MQLAHCTKTKTTFHSTIHSTHAKHPVSSTCTLCAYIIPTSHLQLHAKSKCIRHPVSSAHPRIPTLHYHLTYDCVQSLSIRQLVSSTRTPCPYTSLPSQPWLCAKFKHKTPSLLHTHPLPLHLTHDCVQSLSIRHLVSSTCTPYPTLRHHLTHDCVQGLVIEPPPDSDSWQLPGGLSTGCTVTF